MDWNYFFLFISHLNECMEKTWEFIVNDVMCVFCLKEIFPEEIIKNNWKTGFKINKKANCLINLEKQKNIQLQNIYKCFKNIQTNFFIQP